MASEAQQRALDAAARAAARVVDLLPDRAAISRETLAGEAGLLGQTTTATAVASDVPCRLAPVKGQPQVIAGVVAQVADHVLTLPVGTDLAAGDAVTITRAGGGTVAVRVLAVKINSFATAVRADVRAVRR